MDIRGNVYIADYNGHRVQKFSPTGKFLRSYSTLKPSDGSYTSCEVGLTVDDAGTIYVASNVDGFIRQYSADGSSSKQLPFGASRLSINRRGTRLLAMLYYTDRINFLVSSNVAPITQITGRVYQDSNYSCVKDATEPSLSGIVVVAEPGNYYGLSDEYGNYTIAADTGTYTVRQLLPSNEPGRTIRQTCATAQTVRLSEYGTTVKGPDFGNQVSTAPYLSVSVASNRRRRCFRNVTTVAYGNTGFASAANAKVMVERRFSPDPAGNRVLFQGLAAPVFSATPTTLTVRVPAGAATTDIQVVTADGSARSATRFIVFQSPTLTALSVEESVPGAIITVTGTHFSPLAAQDTVILNGVPARVVQASATSLQVEVPQGATTGRLVVRTLGGPVESRQLFRIWYPPTLTAFSPGKGKAGSIVALTGTNFAEAAARNVVRFGSAAAAVFEASATRLLVRVPVLAQSGAVEVQTPGGTAVVPGSFAFIPAPVITGFTPAEGNAGALITITGQHFLSDGAADTVYFQGVPAAVVSASSTSIVAEVPKSARTGLISVAGAGGVGRAGAEFVVPVLAPVAAIVVYPNPTTSQVTINWRQADFAVQHVRVFNLLGSLLFEQSVEAITTDTVTFNLASHRAGLYLIVLETAKGAVLKRVTLL